MITSYLSYFIWTSLLHNVSLVLSYLDRQFVFTEGLVGKNEQPRGSPSVNPKFEHWLLVQFASKVEIMSSLG